MAITLAVLYVVSIACAAVFVWRAAISPLWKGLIAVAIAIFTVAAFVLAARSDVSPFGASNALSFGGSDEWHAIVVGVVGSIVGVMGSYFYNIGQAPFDWRSFVKPLTTCPIVLVPTVKLIESASDQGLLTLLLLFGMSYQNGFFWERLLAKKPE